MSTCKRLYDLDYNLWRNIIRLYLRNPLEHVYLLYDLIYEVDNTDVYFNIDNGSINGYILVWRGQNVNGVHLWGNVGNLVEFIPLEENTIIHIYNRENLDLVEKLLKSNNVGFKTMYYLDMVVSEKEFTPYHPEKAVKLDPGNRHHIEEFVELKKIQGRIIDYTSAQALLSRTRYYGVFVDTKLVSIACCYLRTNEVWVIGDVYTHPEYRGCGYAKIVTSAITRDAIVSGAKALLHVVENNEPAIRVYTRIGYRRVMRKPWVFIKSS